MEPFSGWPYFMLLWSTRADVRALCVSMLLQSAVSTRANHCYSPYHFIIRIYSELRNRLRPFLSLRCSRAGQRSQPACTRPWINHSWKRLNGLCDWYDALELQDHWTTTQWTCLHVCLCVSGRETDGESGVQSATVVL